jgi:tRNA (guanine-N7-)-methyltransferase
LAELKRQRRIYGRRLGRALNKERREILDELLPLLQVQKDKVSCKADLKPGNLFDVKCNKVWLEIGFGNGEHLSAVMRKNPDNAYIGAEPFINGMSAFLKDIADDPHDRIKVWMDDAIMLAQSFEDKSIDGIYVLNPDPWPKKKHHKRRIINQDNLDIFARILRPDGKLIMTTDVDDLAEWMVTQCTIHPAFEWTAKKADDWRTAPEGWTETRYEQKGEAAGRKQSYLIFKKAG